MTDKRSRGQIFIGFAGWSLPKEHAASFPTEGTHLHRYARLFRIVEINSSFHRPHRAATYAKWASSVPDDFQFAVKVPKIATHEGRLVDAEGVLDRFLSEATQLGEKLKVLLVQLPPSLSFDAGIAERFFAALRDRYSGDIACEPRHASWFEPDAELVMTRFQVARVAADPARIDLASRPGGWKGLIYYRLHGSPRTYYSSYSKEYLEALAKALQIAARKSTVWCIFDNTASGAATGNALDLRVRLL